MTRTIDRRIAFSMLLTGLLFACGRSEEDQELDRIPTQEELDAEADGAIDEANAEEAFEELKNEIETDE